MSIMKTLISIFSAIILALGLSSCGYDGHYRYPCQDPANWQSAECNPPICEATGSCTSDLLGFDPKEGKEEMSEILEEVQEDTTSDIIEEPKGASAPENVDEINQMVDDLSEGN
jgi:hypothetical protein